MKKLSLLLIAACVSVVFINDSFAQSRYQSTKTLALGGAGTAYMNGFEALFINPANIFHKQKGTAITIGIAPFNTQVGGPLVNMTTYNDYFTGGKSYTLSQLKTDVAPAFFDGENSNSLAFQFDVVPLGFSYGNNKWAIAGAARARIINDTQLNSGWMLLMGGINEELFGTPVAMNMSVEALALSEFSVGFAMPVFKMDTENGFHRLTVGVAPKYLMAISYAKIDLQSTMQVVNGSYMSHNINYTLKTNGGVNDGLRNYIADKQAGNALFEDLPDYIENATDNIASPQNGSGFGFDLGLTYEWKPSFNKDLKLVAAFSVTDIGKVTFDKNAGIFRASGDFRFDGLDYNSDRIKNEFNDDAQAYFEYVLKDSLAINSYGNIQEIGSNFTRSLPTMMNFGLLAKWKYFTYTMDIGKGLNDFGINSTNMSFSNGLEAKFWFFPIRVGYRMGGFSSNAVTFGTGIEFRNYEFSLGTLYTPTSENGFKLGIALSTFTIRI